MKKEKLMEVNDFYYAVQKMNDKEAMDAYNENLYLLYKGVCGDDRTIEEMKQHVLIHSLEDRGLFGKGKNKEDTKNDN